MRHLKLLGLLAGLLLLSAFAAGCSSTAAAEGDLAMAPAADLPAAVRGAPLVVREAYQFAVANPDVLQEIPCYCGCVAMGHTSNYSCYVDSAAPGDNVVFDGHALGCSICVDITQDTMRLLQQGKSVADIHAYVDQRYSQYGQPTN